MDPKFLEELQKLKEQKSADLDRLQDLAKLSIPDFDEVDISDEELRAEQEQNEAAGGTIKFERVTNTEPKDPPVPGGRRGKKAEPAKPVVDEATRKRRAKNRKIALIAVSSFLAVVAIAVTVFFGLRNANQKKYTYQYWGMGLAIENGVNSYTFFGNLKEITEYGQIGQITANAEFKRGNCIKETVYTAEGDVDYYYAHEYDRGVRILSSYHKDGQMVQSVKYTLLKDGTVQAETTYYQEDNRTELAILTLSEEGNVITADYYTDTVLVAKRTYQGTLVTEESTFDGNGNPTGRTVFEYNGAKQLLTRTGYDATGAITGRTVNQYNEKNLLTKTIEYDGAGAILEYDTYNYDLNNNPIKQVNYAADGTMQHQVLKVFNDKNRVTKETSLKSDGSIVYCYGYDYDDKGYISKSIIYNTENSTIVDKYTVNTRNDAGTIIETNTHNSANILVEKALYNNSGFLTEHYVFSDAGVLQMEKKSKYDDKQRLTESSESNYNEKGELLKHTSEFYDDKGNVTVRVNENTEEELYEQILFQYGSNGQKEQETMFDRSGKTVYDKSFNEKGQVDSETLYEDGRESVYNEYVYNDKNQVISQKSLDTLTNTLTKTSFTYDKDGVLESALDTNVQNRPVVLREYNEDGTVYKQTNYHEDGTIVDYYRFEYDEEGRVIVKEEYNEFEIMTYRTVYYYRDDGGYDYTLYNGNGDPIEDSRGPEYLPEIDEIPDAPPEEGYLDSDEEETFIPTTDTTGTDTSASSSTDKNGTASNNGTPSDTNNE